MKRPLRTLALAVAPLLGAAFTASPLLAQSPAAPPAASAPRPADSVQEFKLANGMTLIVKPDHRAPTAVHMVWVRVGSMDEVDGSTGLAHMLEHMMFKGSKTVKPGEFSRIVASLGGRDNAFTNRDNTTYFQLVPSSKLEDVMKLESDRFANMQWPDDEFKRELEVVKEERRLRTEDQPRSAMFEQMNAVIYQASPYRRPVIGWMSDLDAMTADDARQFHRRWYTPANAAIVIVGDVDPQAVKRLADKYYGGIAANPVPTRKPRVEPEQVGERRLEFKAPADQSYVALSFKVPKLSSFERTPENDDALALAVLASVLDGYSGARLERALTQGPDRLADGVDAGYGMWGRGPQLFTLSAIPVKGKTAAQLEAGLRAEVARVAKDGVTEAELQRVKTRWIAGEVFKLDSMMNQAQELGSYWIMGMPLDTDRQLIERLRGVTADQVKSVAARYFGDDQMTVAVLHPLPLDPNRRPRTPAVQLRH